MDEACRLAGEAAEGGIAALEIGTPLLSSCGVAAIRQLAQLYPAVHLYADTKLVDLADISIPPILAAGASTISVMLFANDETVLRALDLATSAGADVIFSTMGYPLDALSERVSQVTSLGGRFLLAHGSGVASRVAFNDCMARASVIRGTKGCELGVAGGIDAETLRKALRLQPKLIIAGRSIAQSPNISQTVMTLRRIIEASDER